jgi:hypothetical protein
MSARTANEPTSDVGYTTVGYSLSPQLSISFFVLFWGAIYDLLDGARSPDLSRENTRMLHPFGVAVKRCRQKVRMREYTQVV